MRRIDEEHEVTTKDWIEKVVQIRRVTKVVKGGKKLSFRAIVVVGDTQGLVGVGVGKAGEVIGAIQKGTADARKNLITVPIVGTTIPHTIIGRFGAGKVIIKPAKRGTGVIAGGAVRIVLEAAGIKDAVAKSLGSKSPLNSSRATLKALSELRTIEDVAKMRGKSPSEILAVVRK